MLPGRFIAKCIKTLFVFVCLCGITLVIAVIGLPVAFISEFGIFALGNFPAYAERVVQENWLGVLVVLALLSIPGRYILMFMGDDD